MNVGFAYKTMNIRSAREDDAIKIRELVSRLSHFYLSDDETELPKWLASTFVIEEFRKRLTSDLFTNIVYEYNKNIIGYISIKNKNHIYHLFVSQEHQRKGIAKALWKKALNSFNTEKYSVRSSLYAIPIYESFGFVKSSPIEIKDKLKFQAMEINIPRLREN